MATDKFPDQYDVVITTPLDEVRLGLRFAGTRLAAIDFLGRDSALCPPKSQAQRGVVKQLQGYFSAPAFCLETRLQLDGTPFQRRVWQALRRIPAGRTLTYGELARQLGSSPRAVGGACRSNKIPLVIPCHRVVAKAGLGGFMGRTRGAGLVLKQWLLEHEQWVNDG